MISAPDEDQVHDRRAGLGRAHPLLTIGKYDVIMASMFITPKRLETIDFTQPYAVDPSGFAVAKDSELGKLGVSAEKFKL